MTTAATPPANPALSVFINCPYDHEFEPLFDSIIFATVCCGFQPRSALERADVAKARIERITQAMFACRYSIHDLSRCKGEGDENLARFNMPLELGMAMARRFLGAEEHDWLVLIPDGPQRSRYISDLSGFDPMIYDGTRESMIVQVMVWLSDRPGAVIPFTPAAVWSKLPEMDRRLAALRSSWGGAMRWGDRLSVVVALAQELAEESAEPLE